MKKILAILVALAMVFAFAACGKDDKDDTATEGTTVNIDAEMEELLNNDPVEPATEVITNVDADGNVVTEVITEAAPAGFNSTDPAEVAAFYVAASNKTRDDGKEPAGQQKMVLKGEITGEGAIGTILKFLNPAVASALEKNSTATDYIPGASRGDLQASDISECVAKTDANGNTTLFIKLKSQTDGSDCDGHEAGPVARGIGTLGSIDGALEELGAELISGRDTVSLKYTDAYIKCVVNSDGYIVSGTWHYLVNVHIGDAQAKLGIKANLKNLKAAIDYTVTI